MATPVPPSGEAPVTLAQVLDRQAALQWHEALAIVLELGDVLQRSGRLATPGIAELASVAITPAGTVQVLPGGREGRRPVTDFVHILRALLPADQPVQLRLMLSTAGSDAGEYATIEQLLAALRYYERPGRTEIIRGVYARAHATPPLTHREEPARDVAPPPAAPVRRRRLGKRWVAVGGAAAVCAAAIWVVIELRDDRTAGPDGPAESSIAADAWELIGELARVVTDGARSGLTAIRTRIGSEPEPPAVEEAASPAATPARTDQPAAPASDASPGTASAADAAGSTPLDTATSVAGAAEAPPVDTATSVAGAAEAPPVDTATSVAGAAGAPPLDAATSVAGAAGAPPLDAATSVPARDEGRRGEAQEGGGAEVASSEPAERIYSSNDIGVTPPVTVRPQMPVLPPPGVPADALGIVEVVVSDTGEVESVKLLSPPRNVHERMILSAVKTWQFQPAMKDGRAVRFRHLIPITLP